MIVNFYCEDLLSIEKVVDSQHSFAVAAREPLEFCSNEHVFERFTFFV